MKKYRVKQNENLLLALVATVTCLADRVPWFTDGLPRQARIAVTPRYQCRLQSVLILLPRGL